MSEIISFGEWIKRRRRALDLTQDALAQRAHCSVELIRKIEGDARRPSREIAAGLADALDLTSNDRLSFIQVARAELSADRLPRPVRPTARGAFVSADLQPIRLLTSKAVWPSGTITFLFTEITNSTLLWELHPQEMPAVMMRSVALLTNTVLAHGGVVFKTMDEHLCAAFAQAPDALTASHAAQQAVMTEPWTLPVPLHMRMAIHSGTALLQAGDYVGLTLKRTARLCEAGYAGQILLSLATEQLVREHLPPDTCLRDLGVHRLKDLSLPEQIFQLLAPDLPATFPALNTLDVHHTNLPAQMTTLLGREREVAFVTARLRGAARLITLTGPGGIGKTRLSLQIAADLIDDFADGVYLVDLSMIRDPQLVGRAIAETLAVPSFGGQLPLVALKQHLRDKHMLLVLDNFEQVLAAAPQVAELLAHAAHLNVLVTSREVLHLRGEQEVAITPLAIPDPAHMPAFEQIEQYAAIALLVERARDMHPDFQLTQANAPTLAEICVRLEGLPLAIELAAARLKLFSPEVLLMRLNSRLTFLIGGKHDMPIRQQTIRHTIAWSYDLLNAIEQQLFRQLGIVIGGCTLEVAEAVCGKQNAQEHATNPIEEVLAALIDKSLLQMVTRLGHEPRYVMLETIREYALEQLTASGELGLAQQRHATFFTTWAEAPRDAQLLEAEYPNLCAALAWSQTEADGTIGLRLGRALGHFWQMRSYLNEGRAWLTAVLEPRAQQAAQLVTAADHVLRAEVLDELGTLLAWQSDLVAAQHAFEECLALFRAFGNLKNIACTLSDLGMTLVLQGEYEQSGLLLEESLALHQQLEDTGGIMGCLTFLGVRSYAHGDFARAIEHSTAGLRLARQIDATWQIASSLLDLSLVAIDLADINQARVWLNESMRLFRDMGERWNILRALEACAHVVVMQAEQDAVPRAAVDRAVQIFGAAEALRETLHNPRLAMHHDQYQRGVAAARSQLSAKDFAAAWAAGRALTLEQAIAEALKVMALAVP